jgi:hypothetical protein
MKDAMMEAWLMYTQPGKEHSRLAETVGTWTQENKLWQSPGAEPQVIPTVAEMKTIFGGRYLLQEMKGPMPGGRVSLRGWGSSATTTSRTSTSLLGSTIQRRHSCSEGASDEFGTITYYSEIPDPMTGGMAQVKSVLSKGDENTQAFKMYRKQPDDSWFLIMEIVSTRKK